MTFECITSEQMASLVEGKIPMAEKNRLLKHVVQCNSCYDEYVTLLELQELDNCTSDLGNMTGNGLYISPEDPLVMDFGHIISNSHLQLAAAHENGKYHSESNAEKAGLPEKIDLGNDLKADHAINSFGEHGSHYTSQNVQQAYQDTCAIKAQQLILKDFGIHVSEGELKQEAMEKGWYVPSSPYHDGGTYIQDVGKLLDSHGIEVHQNYGGNVYSLVNELAQGHEVIVDLDAGALWHPGALERLKDIFIGDTPNHALIVAGINTVEPNNVKVILKDPGTGDVAKEYSLGHFMDAWKDSNYFMVSTSAPVPNMKNFDYSKGHIERIDHYSFHDFQAIHAPELEHIDQANEILKTGIDPHDFSGNTYFIHKIVDFFDHNIHHHHVDHTEVNNQDVNEAHKESHDRKDNDYDGGYDQEVTDHY